MPRFPLTDHCDGSRFFNPGAPPLPHFGKVLRWRLTRRVPDWLPVSITPRIAPHAPPADSPAVTATWVNHSTFLLQFAGLTIITDPVFSERIGLLGKIGPRRIHAPGLAFESLPRIDAILLSHDHYDHCDLPALRLLARAHDPLIIAPLGFRPLLRRAKLTRIVELDWWQTHALENATITFTPAQHWSNRLTGPRCGRLWGGFMITTPARRVFFAGDTGYHPAIFHDIATRLGPPDLSLLPIGAYEPRWFMRDQHVNPAEAVQIHRDLHSRLSVGMHWGTFQLTDEPRLAPPADLCKSLAEGRIAPDLFRVMEPGQHLTV
ncbi:MBL fold metallo-hydrolase [Nibricoccus aquaticus]|uniref:MBL fold metallo-hydrolase n=1 Tax=Nibricoccus aquaticus TaxID=2576891 RepID=A0A290QID3_9BACT|nr:MBL fold metallo-hydrolase [Nibricoccus aquaticus]ATC63632.1 MBL fold metallo-hydrolase [Nibricoccus aquaticus]